MSSSDTPRPWQFPTPKLWWLLPLIPISGLLAVVPRHDLALFFTSAGALIPLAELIGTCTEQIGLHAGPRVGGLLNATFANTTELILSIFLLLDGQVKIVKASLAGSILGNLLLVLGVALLAGGLRHKTQRYNASAAGVHATSLTLAVIGFLMPALFLTTVGKHSFVQREVVSGTVAAVLVLVYFAALIFTRITHEHLFRTPRAGETPSYALRPAVLLLAAAAVCVALESQLLVGTLEPALHTLGLSPFFVGLILVPIFGNLAENSSAVRFAIQNKLDTTLEIAIGSSTQVALFIAPALVFISLVVRHPMDFVFSTFEVAAVGLSTLIVTFISHDGRSNWLEGLQLVAAYLIVAASAFFVGSF
jgi:Ca2+:H+ antiporter